jgi:hypothetical protein
MQDVAFGHHVDIIWRRILFVDESEFFNHAGLMTAMGKVTNMLHDIIDTTIEVVFERSNYCFSLSSAIGSIKDITKRTCIIGRHDDAKK